MNDDINDDDAHLSPRMESFLISSSPLQQTTRVQVVEVHKDANKGDIEMDQRHYLKPEGGKGKDLFVQDLVLERFDQDDNVVAMPAPIDTATSTSPDTLADLSTSPPPASKSVVVVGAGVIGITSALVLRELGYSVHVVARDVPSASSSSSSSSRATTTWTAESSQEWASPWAGANWCSYASIDQTREHKWEIAAWYRYMALRETRPDLVEQYPFELFSDKPILKERVWYADLTPDFQLLQPTTDDKGRVQYGMSYRSLGLHVPNYLTYLRQCAEAPELPQPACVVDDHYPSYTTRASWSASASIARPGPPVQFHTTSQLPSLASALDVVPVTATSVTAVVNATALGSYFLSDVLDKSMIPARGQTILVRAPDVRKCSIHPGSLNAHGGTKGGEPSYIIPRALTGDIILGGTFDQGWWKDDEMRPSNATTTRILQECLKMNPALASRPPQSPPVDSDVPLEDRDPHQHALSEGARLGIEVICVNIGLRPNRLEGARLERDTQDLALRNASVPLVHAYGCGPAGFQQSWGIAEEVAELVQENAGAKVLEGAATLVPASTRSEAPIDIRKPTSAHDPSVSSLVTALASKDLNESSPATTPGGEAPLSRPCAAQHVRVVRPSTRNRPQSAGTEAAG